MARWDRFSTWAPYVPVAERRRKAAVMTTKLKKKGRNIIPIRIEGRQIARTFWGKAWCDHLEKYSDFDNRLPRGRTYVRNGSVIDLQIDRGAVRALVSGSSIYEVTVSIRALAKPHWQRIVRECAGKVDSLVDLLQGKLSGGVMEIVTHRSKGLFPASDQISMDCSCPDSAVMCKHVAAVLYGVGARLDAEPELLFRLRGVDHVELVSAANVDAVVKRPAKSRRLLKSEDLAGIFGIEVESAPPPAKKRGGGKGR